jgi:hypothetical protein
MVPGFDAGGVSKEQEEKRWHPPYYLVGDLEGT